ncbi:MAG: hypothetical protein KBA15_08100 [Spirochaetes bacterium]|jgi:hypothetical protein|nr:hypothetical protein [Spirochaetota bacterium]
MNQGVKILLISLLFMFPAVPAGNPLHGILSCGLYAQAGTGPEDGAVVEDRGELAAPVVTKEEPAAKKEPVQAPPPVQKPREAADEASRKKPVTQDEPREAYAGDGLLDITDGAFKYRRIPGIRISESPIETVPPSEASGDARAVEEKSVEDGEKGLFGLSRSATDTLARIVLFGIIILIFVLYRIRARNRRSSVLKRFPKS